MMRLNLVFLCLAGFITIALVSPSSRVSANGRPQSPAPRTIEVVAKRFAFTPSRIEVVEGETVRLLVKSADGVHGLGIKKFKVSEEIPRGGQPITIEFTANAVGEFEILCSEYCGKGHEDMSAKLVVRAREGRTR
jgi:cytochrome c oxidase subunit 2